MEVPLELILSILEWAYYDNTHSPDYSTLSACSLVCRSWNGPSRSFFFRSVAVRKAGICQQLVELFNRDSQSLGSSVRILCLSVGGDTIDPSMLPCVLRAVPRLYELCLKSTGIIEFSAPVMDELRSLATSPFPVVLRSLVVRMGVQSRILYQILDIWPTVQFLRLESECASSPPANRPPFRLYELILLRMPSEENIRWLLAKNDDALRFLELRDDPSTALKSVLADTAKHIRSIRLHRYNFRSAPLVSQCSNLEQLFLWNPPGSNLSPLRNVPASVKNFGFWFRDPLHMSHSVILDRTMAAIAGWPKLHTITCNPAYLEEYREFFHSRNMKVTIQPALSFLLFEDPIVSEHLPRGKSVDNFKLMN